MSTASPGIAAVVGVGVGPGLGAAPARRFAGDYVVALVARDAEKPDLRPFKEKLQF